MNESAQMNDLLIVGGGPAGMSAALVAGRCRLRTVVVNAETPRNRVTTASHGFLTRDGIHPLEMLRIAKEQLEKYPSVSYVNDYVRSVSRVDGAFEVELSAGEVLCGERVILATGFRDNLGALGLPGIEQVYGKSVYPCPFCDGFEHRDQRTAVFGAEGVEHYVPLIKNWTDNVVVFTNGRTLEPEVVAALRRNDVGIEEGKIASLASDDGQLRAIELEDGARVERECGFLFDDAGTPSNTFAEQLGVEQTVNAWGGAALDADEHGKTAVEGVYVVGDAKTGFSGLMAAASEGGRCVEVIVHERSHARWR